MTASVTRRLKRFLAAGPELCSLCHEPFGHNVRTYSGVAGDGALACVGECCAHHLERIYYAGVFLRNKHGVYSRGARLRGTGKSYSTEEVADHIGRLQKAVEAIDDAVGDIDGAVKRAGVKEARFAGFGDTPWKVADAEWFKRHPDRSHHARQPMEGEAEAFGFDEEPPPGHELMMLVRQVEPGRRIRLGFYKLVGLPVPDAESLAHALCDIAARDAGTGKPVNKAELMALCERYARAAPS
jgi:hypothetical protein